MSISKLAIASLSLTAALFLSSSALALGNANDQLDDGIDLYDNNRFENAATTLTALVKASEFRRLDATEKSLALTHLMYSLLDQDKAAEALRHSKALLQHAKNGFGKNSEQYVNALFTKTLTQYRAGKSTNAIRTAEQMAYILERLGDEYRSDLSNARLIPSQIRKKDWNKKDLPMDLSDFYTTCEAINPGDMMPEVSRSLHEYEQVGKDYHPKGRLKEKFKTTYIKHARESSSDRAKRMIYIPDEDHLEHWCVIYPDGGQVDRAVTSPPKD